LRTIGELQAEINRLKDNSWCHLPIIFITNFDGIYEKEFWKFEGLKIDDNEL
jgi:hypothetical protein